MTYGVDTPIFSNNLPMCFFILWILLRGFSVFDPFKFSKFDPFFLVFGPGLSLVIMQKSYITILWSQVIVIMLYYMFMGFQLVSKRILDVKTLLLFIINI